MGQLVVFTSPDLAVGFQLAGVTTVVVEDPAMAEARMVDLLRGSEASLVVVQQDLLEMMSPHLRGQISHTSQPLVISLPVPGPLSAGQARRQQLVAFIRRAIGFHITFGGEEIEDQGQ